ncbi:phosphotransferase family protein [Actinacidiphila rubida]|uniref:Predicted kinase, aminoglycoside phosphotransferase (APT) family n=1 Tax=Actinacidiphila rubida TaxID=310780 RepID=A0A1H8NR15_9ACTN|nr:aminoglycoside phosphotransferase family protein [Actinacidiphila rubida]SEO31793.1 Predicted kinase, aminoglycoside phosphotransferase (APT) family [Actinacidiphila rubida]
MTVTDEGVAAFLARAAEAGARGTGGPVREVTALTGGTYNALYTVELGGGERLVLKVPPPADRPRLRYEAELLCGEALFYRSAAAAGVPAPRVVHAETAEGPGREPFLLMTHVPGVPWWEVAERMADAERERLRGDLGALVARLHTVTGPGFGYPAPSAGPPAARWAGAFAAMTGAVLDDAERYGAWLPFPVPVVRARLAAAADVLDAVDVPALVHFDLWPGNVLIDGPVGSRTISGLIDGERMMWGDPLADFASLSLFVGDAERDTAFLAGYRAGGGTAELDGPALRRIALYRCYLYLIMLVEVVPRGYGPERVAWAREYVGPRLAAALEGAAG